MSPSVSLQGAVLDRLLGDLHLLHNRLEHLVLFFLSAQPQCCQGGVAGKIGDFGICRSLRGQLRCNCPLRLRHIPDPKIGFDRFANIDRLIQSDRSHVGKRGNFYSGIPITLLFMQALFWRNLRSLLLGEIFYLRVLESPAFDRTLSRKRWE
jgi:hypothetical protein